MLSRADIGILDTLSQGRNVTGNIADETEISTQYCRSRLKRMEDRGIVQMVGNRHHGLWEITQEGRELLAVNQELIRELENQD